MEILSGENLNINSGTITYNKKRIECLNPQKRRNLSISFVPEDRLGHSAVPELTLEENTLLSRYSNNKFSTNGLINKKLLNRHTKKIINLFNVISSSSEAKALSLSGGNLQKYVIGREIMSKPDLLIISHPTWGIDAGAENFVRQSLIQLSKNGTSIIIISQDLDELVQISHKLSVIHNGNLSETFNSDKLDIEKIGLLMGGKD